MGNGAKQNDPKSKARAKGRVWLEETHKSMPQRDVSISSAWGWKEKEKVDRPKLGTKRIKMWGKEECIGRSHNQRADQKFRESLSPRTPYNPKEVSKATNDEAAKAQAIVIHIRKPNTGSKKRG